MYTIPSSFRRGVLRRGNSVAWTNGIIPYEISNNYEFEDRLFIIETIQELERIIAINNVQCIRFRPRIPTDRYHIIIKSDNGCYSSIGQITGVQMDRVVSLEDPRCLTKAIIMHELIHTLGFYHEQARPDRDNYVRVNFSNIRAGQEHNFEKYKNSYVDTLGTPYDYLSIMHYGKYDFSSNGFPTIESITPNVDIGENFNLSSIDIYEIRLFYNCSLTGITLPTTTSVNLYIINTTVFSSLTINSSIYDRLEDSNLNYYYYYESYEIHVSSSNYYIFQSNSSISTYGCLYFMNFNPNYPRSNLIQSDDGSEINSQFRITVYLDSNKTYILVLTTHSPLTIAHYTLIISGLTSININKLNSTSAVPRNRTTQTTLSTSTEITSNEYKSIYSSELTKNSFIFNRQPNSDIYYYESIILSIVKNGDYTFQSHTNDSVDTYGYLYLKSFNSYNTSENLLISDNDSGGFSQFLLRYSLQNHNRYILVITTNHPNVTTSFSIVASGSSTVHFINMNNPSALTTGSSSSQVSTTSSASKQSKWVAL
ncbi:hypothetical protein I4U23_017089 [Adineta vaga]|nr:hypothetical protein I4U23_017089 [Adineta vaga]